MLKILWVEDQLGGKQTELFGDRPVTLITNFDEAEGKINSAIDEFDIVVLDIDLDQSEVTDNVRKHAASYELEASEFLKESGMTLFLTLLEKGFPKERIVFLTANLDKKTDLLDKLQRSHEKKDFYSVDSILDEIQNGLGDEKIDEYQKLINSGDMVRLISYLKEYYGETSQSETPNTYNRFCDAYKRCRIQPPEAINKNLNDVKKHISDWLDEHDENQYLVLRRGIIDGCKHVESYKSSDVFFDKYLLENELVQVEDVMNYFGILKNFFPVREPFNKKALYKIFIRTLSHEWEAAKSIKTSLSKIKKDSQLAWIMRNTRHWITHNTNLFNDIDETLVAYLFIINVRVMFNSDAVMRDYESNLLKLFENESLDEDDFIRKKIPVNEAYIALRELVKNNSDDEIKDDYYFYTLANNIQQSKSKIRHDHRLFIKLLYQMFWLLLSYPLSQTKDSKNLSDIEFYKFNYQSMPYLHDLARHIYHRSFPET